MNTRDAIAAEAARQGSITSARVVSLHGISRQAAARHLRELVRAGILHKLGSTKQARYVPAKGAPPAKPLGARYRAIHRLKGLNEHAVMREIEASTGFPRKIPPRTRDIFAYAFTEMLNNAIEHSRSSRSLVESGMDHDKVRFSVRDWGIGVFENIRAKFRMKNHAEAAEHLLKGRQTTAPKRHTGEGIFFTSKIADNFTLESARLKMTVDNAREDVALEEIRNLRGTRVGFAVKRGTRKSLEQLFREYTNAEIEFDRTVMMVHLLGRENDFVSRSQARRLLFGMEKFRRITLDFAKVHGIGQGFADEIFRVYRKRNPGKTIEVVKANAAVAYMIRRATREGRR